MYQKWLKPFLDKIMAVLVLVLLLPFIVMITCISAIVQKGNVWYIQTRTGYLGKPFSLLKFKTLLAPGLVAGETYDDPISHKPLTMTGWGKFLRIYGLDELPQLINIIQGDLSWVGPRPLLPEYLPFYTRKENLRHQVKPGLTGLAQINGKNNVSWTEKLDYDSKYAQNASFWLDATIVLKTFLIFFKPQKHVVEVSLSDERSVSSSTQKDSHSNQEFKK